MLIEPIRRILGARRPRPATWCPVCGRRNVQFVPLPAFYRDNAARHGFVHFGKGEMTAHDTYACSHCGASDRERLYAMWIDRQVDANLFSAGQRLIHFAPEAALSKKLRSLGVFEYVTADLLMDDVDHKVDMMNMPFATCSIDFFVCSHVLEHVESDDRAISELYRITKRGGGGILMVPIIVGLEQTIEDRGVTSEAERWRLYGQGDHVRLYAHASYVAKVRSSGFSVAELGSGHFGEDTFRLLGLKSSSILYVMSKCDSPWGSAVPHA